jgi:hypothetical protein
MLTSSKMNGPGKVVLLSVCLMGFTAAGIQAQSIIGKWKQVSAKMYCTPDAVKNSHGHMQEVMDMPKVNAVDEFKSDHSLVETITTGTSSTTNSGTWKMVGKTVTITIAGRPPMDGTVSDSGGSLVYTMQMPKTEHQQVIKREWTFEKA